MTFTSHSHNTKIYIYQGTFFTLCSHYFAIMHKLLYFSRKIYFTIPCDPTNPNSKLWGTRHPLFPRIDTYDQILYLKCSRHEVNKLLFTILLVLFSCDYLPCAL